MNGQDRHGGVETLVIEGKIVGAGLNCFGRPGAALPYHLARRLDRGHGSIGRLVGTGARADVQHGARRSERALDGARYPPVRLAKLRVIDADIVIFRGHRSRSRLTSTQILEPARLASGSVEIARSEPGLETRLDGRPLLGD